jgi:hypothetical protein
MNNTHATGPDPATDLDADASRRRIWTVAVPAAAVAGTITALSLASGLPAVVGAMTYNHNETLVTSADARATAERPRAQPVVRARRHVTALALAAVALAGPTAITTVVSSSAGPAYAGFGTSPGGATKNHNETLLHPYRVR